jgi:hypothetical protein
MEIEKMTNACTQNTDRNCDEQSCCLNKKKTRLIPFDYDRYKAGLRAKCNDIYVDQLHLFSCNHMYPLIGVIDNYMVSFTTEGTSNLHHGHDLLLEEPVVEKTFYANVYSNGDAYFHASLELAKSCVDSNMDSFVGHLKITYTEEDLIR